MTRQIEPCLSLYLPQFLTKRSYLSHQALELFLPHEARQIGTSLMNFPKSSNWISALRKLHRSNGVSPLLSVLILLLSSFCLEETYLAPIVHWCKIYCFGISSRCFIRKILNICIHNIPSLSNFLQKYKWQQLFRHFGSKYAFYFHWHIAHFIFYH